MTPSRVPLPDTGSSGKNMPERRHSLRHSTCAPCPPAIVNFHGSRKAVLIDLNIAGFGVVSAINLEVGLMPHLQLELPQTGPIDATARVVWSNSSGRAGVALSNPLPNIREEIRDWLSMVAPAETETAPPYPGSSVDSLSDWVTAPLSLSPQVLQHGVENRKLGVYMLGYGNGEFHPIRVGRADDLRECLVAYIGQYDQFLYAYSSSDHDAFRRECRLYHHYRPRNNRSHPARSPGTRWDCPVCHGFK